MYKPYTSHVVGLCTSNVVRLWTSQRRSARTGPWTARPITVVSRVVVVASVCVCFSNDSAGPRLTLLVAVDCCDVVGPSIKRVNVSVEPARLSLWLTLLKRPSSG